MPTTLPHKDQDYWSNPTRDRATLVMDVLTRDPLGFVVGGPASIAIEEHDTLPLVGYYKCTTTDEAKNRLERETFVVAGRADGGAVQVGRAFMLRERPTKKPDDDDDEPGKTASYFQLDARAQLGKGLEWREGTLRLRLVNFDQLSAPVQVKLVSQNASDPAVREFIDRHRRPGYPAPVSPPAGEHYPKYAAEPGAPPVPAAQGIAIAVERVALLDRERPCVLRGSFKVALRDRDRVKPRPKAEPGQDEAKVVAESGWQDVGDPKATAVVPITVLLLRKGSPGAGVVELRVPVYGASGPEATGHFAIDLMNLGRRDVQLMAAPYCVYAFAGADCAGPAQVTFVSPDQLPRPGE